MKNWVIMVLAGLAGMSFSSGKPAYRIYTSEGKAVGYTEMVRDLAGADIILFGDQHDNPIAHWLQRPAS